MRAAIITVAMLGALLSGCLKDEVDIDALTTNPLDPDYDGTPFIELVSDTTLVILDANNDPIDTITTQVVQVREDLLAPDTYYTLYITKENSGEAIDSSSALPQPDVEYHHVVLGTGYCWSYQLKVQYSLTRKYTFCTTASL